MVLGVGGIRGLVLRWLGCFLSSLFFFQFLSVYIYLLVLLLFFLVRDKGG